MGLGLMDVTKSESDIPIEVRRNQMLGLVKAKEFVRVADLSERFGVSEVTVRGDLDALAERGQIRRIRGGAVPNSNARSERPFEETQSTHVAEKHLIASVAASLISSGETLILDVGTTTTAIAHELVMRTDLHDIVVFTNAINIALELE